MSEKIGTLITRYSSTVAGVDVVRTLRVREDVLGTPLAYEVMIEVRHFGRSLFIAGHGATIDEAEAAAGRTWNGAVDNLDHVGEIWRRKRGINWWAAEHSKEVGNV